MSLCIAIYDRDDVLLYLGTKENTKFSPTDVHRFLHSSCDIAADKVNNLNKSIQSEQFIGSLLLNDQFRSFAYLTNTGTKFVLVVDVENDALKEHEVRLFFKKLHANYCNAISNPFYRFGGSPLKSRYIDDLVKELFDSF